MSVLTSEDLDVVSLAIVRARAPRARLTRTQALAPHPKKRKPVEKREPLLFVGLCSYCGAPALFHQNACEGHSDLSALDGATSAVVTHNTNGTRRSTYPGSAAGATRRDSR